MSPRGIFGESFQKSGSRAGSAETAATVFDEGDIATDLLFKLWVEGHWPEAFAGFFCGIEQALTDGGMIIPKTCRAVT